MTSPVKKRKLGMKMKMNKLRSSHGGVGSLAGASLRHCEEDFLARPTKRSRDRASWAYSAVEVSPQVPCGRMPPRPFSVIPAKAGIRFNAMAPGLESRTRPACVVEAAAEAPGLSLTPGGLDAFTMNGFGSPPHDRYGTARCPSVRETCFRLRSRWFRENPRHLGDPSKVI